MEIRRSLSLKQNAKLARRVYAAFLHLYPADFRRDYAKELTLLFLDLYRVAAARGTRASVSLWLTVLLDLLSSAIRERIRMMLNPKWASVISIVIFVPTAFFFSLDLFNYEPRVVQQFFTLLFTPDDDFNLFGRIFEIFLILSAPIAFMINLLSMFRKAKSEQNASFRLTRAHALIGSSILILVLILFSKAVLFSLPWLGPELGEGPIISQVLCPRCFCWVVCHA